MNGNKVVFLNKPASTFILIITICFFGFAVTTTVPSEGISSITEAVSKARPGDSILVDPGVYKDHPQIFTGITLISKQIHKAIIDGGNRGSVVTISQRSSIIGFEVRNGDMGIVTRGPEITIQSCKICYNRGSGILSTGNLPTINNNIIVYNDGSAIQALDITTGATTISHNTIAYNGNNGIAFSGTSSLTIENNIFSQNAGAGVKFNPENNRISIVHNLFYQNGSFMSVIPENNYNFDPLFQSPKKRSMDFSLKMNSQAINKAGDGKNLGALMLY